jgi:hypothetical protein
MEQSSKQDYFMNHSVPANSSENHPAELPGGKFENSSGYKPTQPSSDGFPASVSSPALLALGPDGRCTG